MSLQRILVGIALSLLMSLMFSLGMSGVGTMPAWAQDPEAVRTWIPIGAEYAPETLQLFAQQAINHNQDSIVQIRILLPPFSTNSFFVGFVDRQSNLEEAKERASQVQSACLDLVTPPVTCNTTVPDIQIRNEAQESSNLSEFSGEIDGLFALGGNQTIAMQVMANTQLEDILESLYRSGVPMGGTSAGTAMMSRYMVAGYVDDFNAWNGLELGSIDLAYSVTGRTSRGLRFGLDTAILDQHVLERGRILRLLQAVEQSPVPKVGAGLEKQTGSLIRNDQILEGVKGLASALVLDLETYQSADHAQYTGSRRSLAIRNVAMHLLPQGDNAYNFRLKRPLQAGSRIDPPHLITRAFDFLKRPTGSAPVIIGGDLLERGDSTASLIPFIDAFADESAPDRFVLHAKAAGGNTAVLAVGQDPSTLDAATRTVKGLRLKQLKVKQETLTPTSNIAALAIRLQAEDAIVVTASNQQEVAALVDRLRRLNLDGMNQSGTPLLFDNAAAAAVGQWMTSEPGPADTIMAKESQATSPYLIHYPFVEPGLNLIPGTLFEPRAFYDYRYGRLVQAVFQDSSIVAFGIERETALEITPDSVSVLGPAAVLDIDGRYATQLAAGDNGAIAAQWLLLDTFTSETPLS